MEFVAEQWPALGKIDAGATVQALAAAKPEAIFNVTFGADLTNFVREGNTRGLFERRGVVSLLTGEPEYLDPLGDETPEGWIVTGYPVGPRSPRPSTRRSRAPTRRSSTSCRSSARWSATTLIHAIVAGIAQGRQHRHREAWSDGLRGAAASPPPFGRRDVPRDRPPVDAGRLRRPHGAEGRRAASMVDWRYVDGANYLPPDDEVRNAAAGRLNASGDARRRVDSSCWSSC